MGSRETELRAVASSCIVASAPVTAPSASQPATFSLTPMNNPFDCGATPPFQPAQPLPSQYIPASKFGAQDPGQSCVSHRIVKGRAPLRVGRVMEACAA